MTDKPLVENNTFIQNKLRVYSLVLILVVLTVATTLLLYYPVTNTESRLQDIKDGFDNNTFYGPGRACLFSGGFASLIKMSDEHFLSLQDVSVFNPVYVLVRNIPKSSYTNDTYVQYLTFIHFQRTGVFSFEPIKTQGGEITNYSLDSAKKLIRNHNLLNQNPDPENIKIVPAKSDEELMQIAAVYCNEDNLIQEKLDTRHQAVEEFDSLSSELKIQKLENEINFHVENKTEFISNFGEDYYNDQITILQEMITEIKQADDTK